MAIIIRQCALCEYTGSSNKMLIHVKENHCKQFLFCELDAYDITKKYKAREKKVVVNQPTLF